MIIMRQLALNEADVRMYLMRNDEYAFNESLEFHILFCVERKREEYCVVVDVLFSQAVYVHKFRRQNRIESENDRIHQVIESLYAFIRGADIRSEQNSGILCISISYINVTFF